MILINDISDHLRVFTVYDIKHKKDHPNKKPEYRRMRTGESVNTLKYNILAQNWEILYKEYYIDSAYEGLLRIFRSLYD